MTKSKNDKNSWKIIVALIAAGAIIIISYMYISSDSRPKIDVTTPNGTNIHIEKKR